MFQLYPYQQDFKFRLGKQYARGHRRVLGVAPTGSGKTVVFANIILGAAAKGLCFVIAHRTEICDQICAALAAMDIHHGRIQAGHRPTEAQVQVCMVQSLANRAAGLPAPAFIVFDEAHHCIAGSYMALLKRWPLAKVLGVTATPIRLDGHGLGQIYQAMVVGPTTRELIDGGFLADFSYLAPPTKVDLTGIRAIGGDYNEAQLAEEVDRADVTGDAFEHYMKHLQGRPTIAFCVGVEHAQHVAEYYRARGIRAASVDGSMDRETRRERIEGIGNGQLQVLTSCELIGEGLDVPVVAGAQLLRPTMSLGLHRQQIGRALRRKPDGSKAVILDHVGNVDRHGPPDKPIIWTLDDKEKAKPIECQMKGCGLTFARRPDWRKHAIEMLIETGQKCPFPNNPGCVLVPEVVEEPEEAEAGETTYSDAELVEITSRPDWAKGQDILTARGADWFRLLRAADTPQKLEQIRRLRGYRPGWVFMVLRDREERRQ